MYCYPNITQSVLGLLAQFRVNRNFRTHDFQNYLSFLQQNKSKSRYLYQVSYSVRQRCDYLVFLVHAGNYRGTIAVVFGQVYEVYGQKRVVRQSPLSFFLFMSSQNSLVIVEPQSKS